MVRTCKRSVLSYWAGGVSAIALCCATFGAAHAEEEVKTFNIPAQSLADALAAYSQQSDVIVFAPSSVLENKESSGVTGDMTPTEALEKLTGEHSLNYSSQPDGSIVVTPASATSQASRPASPVRLAQTRGGARPVSEPVSQPQSDDSATPARRGGSLADEVIVTAQKREQTLVETPLSIQAFSGDVLDDLQVRNADDLARISPSLLITKSTGASAAIFSIRGIGTSGNNPGLEQSVGTYSDGVFRSRPSSALQDLVDLERVEVLRGPQATIFGRNNSAGALNIVTRAPEYEYGGKANFSYGRFDAFSAQAMITGALVPDKVAFRLSGSYRERDDGEIENLNGQDVGGQERYVLRGQLLFDISEDTGLRLIGDYSESEDRFGNPVPLFISDAERDGFLAIGATIPGLETATPGVLTNSYVAFDPVAGTRTPTSFAIPGVFLDPDNRTIAVDDGNEEEVTNFGVSAELSHDFGFGEGTLLVAHRQSELEQFAELDQFDAVGPPPFFERFTSATQEEFDDTSLELRFTDETGGPIDWLAGFYYFHQGILRVGGSPSLLSNTISDLTVNSYAGFGQATWNATDRISLTGGLRYLSESKEADFGGVTNFGIPLNLDDPLTPDIVEPNARETEDDALIGSVSVGYELDGVGNLYARYAQGYKSGGINLSPRNSNVDLLVFDPENADNYEIGGKFRFLDNQLRVNVTGFYQQTEDLQVQAFVIDETGAPRGALINAAEVEAKGVELEYTALPTDRLTLSGGVTYLDSTYEDFDAATAGIGAPPNTIQDLTGETTANSPKWTINGLVEYVQPLLNEKYDLIGRLDYQFRTEYNTSLEDEDFLRNDDTFYLNLSLELASVENGWSIQAFGQNITDEISISDSISPFGGPNLPFNTSLGLSPAVLVGPPRIWGVNVDYEF